MRWWWSLALVWACLDNPTIDGSTVAPITDPNPPCADYPDGAPGICTRIQDLCGYAPLGNDGGCTNDAGTGYCDTQFAGSQPTMQCIGTATSCQEVWDTTAPSGGATVTGCLYLPVPDAAPE